MEISIEMLVCEDMTSCTDLAHFACNDTPSNVTRAN